MTWLRRLVNLAGADRLSRDIEREMAFHIAERAEELRRGGMSESEALLEARRRFGNRTLLGERTREADVVAWLDSVLGDLRYAVRTLRRAPAFTLVVAATLGLGIGAVLGLYAVIAYGVAQRTREIGIRVAVGATGGDVVRLVLGEGAKLIGIGLAVGVAGAAVATRFIRAMLFQTTAADPIPYLAVVAVLGGAALLATYLPARRAARTDPTIAMRAD